MNGIGGPYPDRPARRARALVAAVGRLRRLDDELSSLVVIPITDSTWDRAHEVQRRLAHVRGRHHRSVKIADLVIAAAAEQAGATVWHYHEDFEHIAAITDQPIS